MKFIVNADDFGLTPGVNRSVAELARAGAISSATLMATGGFFEQAVAAAKASAHLEVGCHVLLVDGTPVLPPAEIPSLLGVDRRSFRPTLSRLALDLVTGRVRSAEIRAEAAAQIRRLQAAGLTVSHIDTHKHSHSFPQILKPLLEAAQACGIPAIRNPFEPAWAVRATASGGSAVPLLRRLAVTAFATQHRRFVRLVREHGMGTTSGILGVLATGGANTADEVSSILRSLLESVPKDQTDAVWELVCHPGYPDEHLDQVRTRLRASRGAEHAALEAVIPAAGIELASWRDLGRAQ